MPANYMSFSLENGCVVINYIESSCTLAFTITPK